MTDLRNYAETLSDTITQEEIHVYLSLIDTVKDMKGFFMDRLQNGTEVEPGIHGASLSTFNRSTMPAQRLKDYIVFKAGQKALDSLIKRHTSTQEITRLNIK